MLTPLVKSRLGTGLYLPERRVKRSFHACNPTVGMWRFVKLSWTVARGIKRSTPATLLRNIEVAIAVEPAIIFVPAIFSPIGERIICRAMLLTNPRRSTSWTRRSKWSKESLLYAYIAPITEPPKTVEITSNLEIVPREFKARRQPR